jgi:hypothetical protein
MSMVLARGRVSNTAQRGANVNKLDAMACWKSALASLGQHREAIIAIAGVFLFLPGLLSAQFIPEPRFPEGATFEQMAAIWQSHAEANLWPLLLTNLVQSYGALALYRVLARTGAVTIGQILRDAAMLFPAYMAVNLLTGLLVLPGLILFIVPGIYILVRLNLSPMVMVTAQEHSPLAAMRQSWALTRGNVLPLLVVLLVVGLVGALLVSVLLNIIGLALVLTIGDVPLVMNLLSSAASAILAAIIVAIVAAAYHLLAPRTE